MRQTHRPSMLPWLGAFVCAALGFLPEASNAALMTYVIESRSGGQNFARYSDTGSWFDREEKSSATDLTAGIGARAASTNLPGVGENHAIFTPDLPSSGRYEVFSTWGSMGGLRSPILHRVTHAAGTTDVDIDQSEVSNEWVSLGEFVFSAGTAGSVDISNLHMETFGNMLADSVKWELIEVVELVPEPTTAGLAGLALLWMAVGSRRRIG